MLVVPRSPYVTDDATPTNVRVANGRPNVAASYPPVATPNATAGVAGVMALLLASTVATTSSWANPPLWSYGCDRATANDVAESGVRNVVGTATTLAKLAVAKEVSWTALLATSVTVDASIVMAYATSWVVAALASTRRTSSTASVLDSVMTCCTKSSEDDEGRTNGAIVASLAASSTATVVTTVSCWLDPSGLVTTRVNARMFVDESEFGRNGANATLL